MLVRNDRLKVTFVNGAYDFTDYGQSVSSEDFDTHGAWGGVCDGADDGHGGDDEEGGLHGG